MRTLLRKIPSGTYFQSLERWTKDPLQAMDLCSMRHALELAEKAGYRNIEVAFLYEHPRRIATVRPETLDALEQ